MGNETTVQETDLQESKWNKIKFINRDMLKYMALFLMCGGHLILYIGMSHFIDWMPKIFLRLFVYGEMCSIVVITFFYNGKKGHFPTFSKWAFYVFYPLHLLVAFVAQMVLG